MVIDTHTHAWGPPSTEHPWVNENILESIDQFDVETAYGAESLLADMDRLRIDEAVVVGYPIVEWTDNWYTVKAAVEHDRLFGVVMLDHFGEDAVERARRTLSTEGVIGMRIAPGHHYDHMWRPAPNDETATWLFEAIERRAFWEVAREENSVITISAGYEHLDQIGELIETYPDLVYLFDGYGPLSADSPDEHFEALAEFARFENVGVKASHTPFVSNRSFPYEDVHEVLYWLLEEFGRERIAWGSDFPNVTQHPDGVTYAEAFDWLYHVDGLSETDRRYLEGDAWEAMTAEAMT